MPEISLPQKVFFGDESIQKFAQSCYENILILSDAETVKQTESLGYIQDMLGKKTPNIKLLVSKIFDELYEKSIKYISETDPDRIIAVGSAWLIDAAMFISYQSGIDFAAVPYFSSCSMTDFPEADYRTYRLSPAEVVLDPDLAMQITSGTIAYDAMSCLAYASDAIASCNNYVIASLALSSATMPSVHTGEISNQSHDCNMLCIAQSWLTEIRRTAATQRLTRLHPSLQSSA